MAKTAKWLTQSVDEIIDELPKEEKVVVQRLRSLILECIPHIKEKNSYGAPFYSYNRMICYIWPPCLQWGTDKKKDHDNKRGVTLGFWQGDKISNEDGVLRNNGGKKVYWLFVMSLQELDEDRIRALLYEADMIDKTFAKEKKKLPR